MRNCQESDDVEAEGRRDDFRCRKHANRLAMPDNQRYGIDLISESNVLMRIINEPNAVETAHGSDKRGETESNITHSSYKVYEVFNDGDS